MSVLKLNIISVTHLSQLMRLWYLSHRCLAKAHASWSMEVDEGSDQKSDARPHWMAALRLRVWRMSSVYAKSSEVLPDICQIDWIFLQDRMKMSRTEKILRVCLSTDFNHQFAKTYSESKRKGKWNHHFKCFSLYDFFVSFFVKILSNQGHGQWQNRMVSHGSALLDLQLSAFFGFATNILRKQ